MLAPSSLWARHWGDATWMLARRGGRESEKGVSAGAWSRSTGAGWIDCGESGRERSPRAWSQRSGTGKRRRSEEVWLMTCRLCSVSAATPARSRMRTPRSRSCGRRNAGMGRAAGVVHPGRYPTAVVGRRPAGRHRGMRGPSMRRTVDLLYGQFKHVKMLIDRAPRTASMKKRMKMIRDAADAWLAGP